MASGISNTCRIGGLAVGVAVFGALLQQRVGDRLAAAGYPGKALAAAVSSSGPPRGRRTAGTCARRQRRLRQRVQAGAADRLPDAGSRRCCGGAARAYALVLTGPLQARYGRADAGRTAEAPADRAVAAFPEHEFDAILFVSFGGPEGTDDVLPFLGT